MQLPTFQILGTTDLIRTQTLTPVSGEKPTDIFSIVLFCNIQTYLVKLLKLTFFLKIYFIKYILVTTATQYRTTQKSRKTQCSGNHLKC